MKEGILLSALSDIEMLSVQGMEVYAKRHGLTGSSSRVRVELYLLFRYFD